VLLFVNLRKLKETTSNSIKLPKSLFYQISFKSTKEYNGKYEPEPEYLIAFTYIMPKRVDDVNTNKCPYNVAYVIAPKDDFSGELSILSSKCITEFDLRKNDAPEIYAIIKGRILLRIHSLDTRCFNLSCIFVDYEEEVSITEIVKALYGNELVDCGDIHNILDFNLAKKFSCKMEAITLLMVVKGRGTRLQTPYIGVQCVSKLCHDSWGSSKLHMECLAEGEILILWKNKILKQPKPIDDLHTPFEELFAYS